jgi:pre-mRNA-splicing factor 18
MSHDPGNSIKKTDESWFENLLDNIPSNNKLYENKKFRNQQYNDIFLLKMKLNVRSNILRNEIQKKRSLIGDALEYAKTNLKNSMDNENSSREKQCLNLLINWCECWKNDLLSRPHDVSESIRGRLAFDDYIATMRALLCLFEQIKSRTLPDELSRGIWLMVKAMKDRNYLHANAILLNAIAIGNAPWPIGVTQVGIHTKSAAREKISISHLNKNAAAHIMGDEATRKYLHGLKRLLTVIQRVLPTDPSRSVDFSCEIDASKGASGSGSMKLALREAEQKGDIVMQAPVQSLLQYDADGGVKVPYRLSKILKQA